MKKSLLMTFKSIIQLDGSSQATESGLEDRWMSADGEGIFNLHNRSKPAAAVAGGRQ